VFAGRNVEYTDTMQLAGHTAGIDDIGIAAVGVDIDV
jgi:hypothetical protein